MSDYMLDQAFPTERARLEAMAAHWDPGTARLFDDVGLAPGWRCLEAGAGSGTVARLLAERTGPQGHVLAVDRDPRFLDDLPGNVEVRALDLLTDPLPQEEFDLVHARMVVEHLPPQLDTLRLVFAAVKPGGWLVVEDVDHLTSGVCVPASPVHTKMMDALFAVAEMGGYEHAYARRLYADALTLGGSETRTEFRGGQIRSDAGTAWAPWQLMFEQFVPLMTGAGLVTDDDVAAWYGLSRDGTSVCTSPIMFSVSVRK